MKSILRNRSWFFTLLLAVMMLFLPMAEVNAGRRAMLFVDDDGGCNGRSPCYTHPQDAVNAANPGDIILVYPGTYGSRQFTTPVPPHWPGVPNNQYAPALIVYKDGLTIMAVDPDPSKTIIESTHDYWSNPEAVQASTGGTWDGTQYVGAGVNPTAGTAPNAVAIIASNVNLKGFTLRKPNMGVAWWGFFNTAGVMIGGLYNGDPDHLGASGNTVMGCVFRDVHHAVYIWHSSGNRILNNTVEALGEDSGHWAAISIYDGHTDEAINIGYTSKNNSIIANRLVDKGIFVGAWAPPSVRSDNSGTKIHANKASGVFTAYSSGSKMLVGNQVDWCGWYEASDFRLPKNCQEGTPTGWPF